MTKFKFEVGKTYKTRGGRKALVLSINLKNNAAKQIKGLCFEKDGSSSAMAWYIDGRFFKDHPRDQDLMPSEPEKKVIKRWFNIYPSGYFEVFQSKKIADYGASNWVTPRVACVYREIEYYEGEGLDE
jgi:hypothetical protein